MVADDIVHQNLTKTLIYGVKMAGFDFGGLGSVLGSGLDFLGGMLGRGQQNSQFQQSAQQAQQQLQFQMDAAKQGITWRVQDAKNAGISPLVALGAPTFNPGAIGLSAGGVPSSSSNFAGSFGALGQDISRAVGGTQTAAEKQQIAMAQARLANETKVADANANMLNSQAAVYNQRLMSTPPFPSPVGTNFIPGQGNTPITNTGSHQMKPAEVQTAQPGTGAEISGGPPGPSVTYHRVGDGLQAFPAKINGLDDFDISNPLGIDWTIRNRIMPNLGGATPPTLAQMKAAFPGATGMQWNPATQTYKPLYNNQQGLIDRYTTFRNSVGQSASDWLQRQLWSDKPGQYRR